MIDEVGELVITEPMPSMPLFLWGDGDGSRYRASYFDHYPGIWRHGDWIEITSRGTAVIYGRSDSTINRQGVRMGTSEIYRAVQAIPEVLDALVVDVPRPGTEGWMPLFVVLREGAELDEELEAEIKRRIRERCSPRHVPNAIYRIAEVPRTLSGKVLEVPVKRILMGTAAGAGGEPRLARQPGGARLLRRAGREARPRRPERSCDGLELVECVAVQQREERLDDPGVELGAGVALQLLARLRGGHRRAVGAVVGHRLVGVPDREDPRLERDLLLANPERIAEAVRALVVGADPDGDVGEPGVAGDPRPDRRGGCASPPSRRSVSGPGLARIEPRTPILPTS